MLRALAVVAALACSAAGCGKSDDKATEAETADETTAPAQGNETAAPKDPADPPAATGPGQGTPGTGAAASIETIPFQLNDAIDKDMPIKGKVIAGQRWTDANGDNLLVQSLLEKMAEDGRVSIYLYANHFVRGPDGTAKQLREVKDKYEDCEFDNMTRFLEDASQVTDLDNDGLGEVWFAYVADCASDVSPLTTKLLGLENGDKYIIRGTIDFAGLTPGTKKVDASLKKGPKEFAAHADQLWAKLAKTE
jgi:hypothetical protein